MKIYTVKPLGASHVDLSFFRGAFRSGYDPSGRGGYLGFRLVFKDHRLTRSGCILPTVTYRGTGTDTKTSFRFVV